MSAIPKPHLINNLRRTDGAKPCWQVLCCYNPTKLSAKEIINGTGITVPPSGRRLVDVLQKYSPRAIGTLTQSERNR